MFTDEDYKDYLEAIIALETSMVFFTANLRHKISDEEIVEKLEEVLNDETKHYAMGIGLYSTFFPEKGGEEKLPKSVFVKGAVTLTGKDGKVISADLLSYTSENVGIECLKELANGESYEMEISLNDTKSAERKKGEVVWFKPLKPEVNIASIRFT